MHQVLQSSTVHPQESQYHQYPYPSAPYLKLACLLCLICAERDALSSSRPSDMLAHLGRLSGGFKAACHGKKLRSMPGLAARGSCAWPAGDAVGVPSLRHPMPRSFPHQSRMSNKSNIFQHPICICVEASCRVAGASLLRLQDSRLKAIILVRFGIH